MGRILTAVVILLLLCLAGVAGYAYFGDITPKPSEHRESVTLQEGAIAK